MSELPLVLDLDLDFFLDGIRLFSSKGRAADLHPWTEVQFSNFLETPCGLSIKTPLPGRVVKRHHQAFHFWRDMVRRNRLPVPFRLVHIDAHADLGNDLFNAYAVLEYLSRSVLPQPIERRQSPRVAHKCLWETNYLLFAVACGWINEINFVTHPDWRDDFHWFFVRKEENETLLELIRFRPDVFDLCTFDFDKSPRLSVEASVPLRTVPGHVFRAPGPFVAASLSISPNYTPPAADALVNVFRLFINEDCG